MVFCFHCYHQKDWWRLTHSYDLGTKAKQKKCWLLVLIRVEKTISALLPRVSQLSQSSALFPLHLTHSAVKSHCLLTPGQFYWIHEHSTQELRNISWCCEMLCHGLPADAVNVPWFSGCIPPTAQEKRADTSEPVPAEGSSPCAFHCSWVRAVGNNSLQDQEPARTQFQGRDPEASNREGLGCVGSCECSGGKQPVTVSGGFLTVQWTAQWH